MPLDPIVIVSAKRTPLGNFLGCFKSYSASQLAGLSMQACLEHDTHFNLEQIDEVFLGCVLSAGQGQAPARQALFHANLPETCGATTINKVCGSGMQAIILSHDRLMANSAKIMLAGGMENMSQAPYLSLTLRTGHRLNHDALYDHIFLDGLEDAYDKGKLMGHFAEETAKIYGFTREQQDAYALQSLTKAKKAQDQGYFNQEIVPIPLDGKIIKIDEGLLTARPEKIPLLKPRFHPEGSITAANASSLSDGAATVLCMKLSTAEQYGYQPLAFIRGHARFATTPALFPIAPIGVIQRLLLQLNWSTTTVDLWEINEAFAVVSMAAEKTLKLDPKTVNIHGGACVLGHPIGASGARILVTLLHALRQHSLRRGIACLCIGGGEATAMAIEIVSL